VTKSAENERASLREGLRRKGNGTLRGLARTFLRGAAACLARDDGEREERTRYMYNGHGVLDEPRADATAYKTRSIRHSAEEYASFSPFCSQNESFKGN